MSQALLISNDDIINDIYAANLHIYVATNVTVKPNHEQAIKLLEQNPNVDLIICLARIENENTAQEIINYLENKKSNLNMIVIGNEENLPNNCISVSAKYDIRNIVRNAAKFLEITAKDMSELTVPDYFPVPVTLFKNMSKAGCNVYYQVKKSPEETDYVKIFNAGSKIDLDVEKYINQGVSKFYVPALERLNFINQASDTIVERLNSSETTNDEKIELTIEGMEVVATQVTSDEAVSEEIVKISESCMKAVTQVARDVPKIRKLLEGLVSNKTKFIYLHGIMASYVSTFIIDNISWGGKGQAEKIAFVLFFHDIFLVPIFNKYPEFKNEEELLYSDKLSDQEKDLILNHAKMAGELINTFKSTPIGASTIATQHHGSTQGVGFVPKPKDDISPLAKVIIIAEDFVSELLKYDISELKEKFNQEDVINEMYGKYRNQTYRKIIDVLKTISL